MSNICILIFCEGDTEYNYIISLQRFLRDEDCFDFVFYPKNLKGLSFDSYLKKIKGKIKDTNGKFDHFYIWIDYDIFKRKKTSEEKIKQEIKKIKIPSKMILNKPLIIIFNYMNGEDFMVLHYDDNKVSEWKKICSKKKHFESPMCSTEYMPLFKEKIKEDYKKGEFPHLNVDILNEAIRKSEDKEIEFSSGMADLLKSILEKLSSQ